jgi:DNA recombination protein RmuC
MNGLVEQIGDDPMLMVSIAIGVVLILFVVLVVVVANMRIRTYKDRYVNTRIDNVEKEKQISTLQKEMQEVKIRNAQNEQALQQFSETKKRLFRTEEILSETQKELGEIQKVLAQTKAQLENLQAIHAGLLKEHESFRERFEHLQEENSKLRVNNARLLMKLETEERFNAHHQRRSEKDGEHP